MDREEYHFVYIIVSSFFLLLLCSFQQASTENIIYWAQTKNLSWDDFKGTIEYRTKLSASTECSINVRMIDRNESDSVDFLIESIFSKNGSWIKNNEKNDFLLKHEQGHFDINEIFARKLRKEISKKYLTFKNVIFVYKAAFLEINDALNKEQVLYDLETTHSMNKEKQIEWDKKIENQLLELKQFFASKTTVFINSN